ncbi:MAG: hypothetical protein IJP98_02345 [Clostridia bacterium]|nr:hypothetical protein [Clostridia bacterium]
MTDLFLGAAVRAQRKKREEAAQGSLLDTNEFAKVVETQRQVRAEEAEEQERVREAYRQAQRDREAANMAEMECFLEEAKLMLNRIGRPVNGFFINQGGEIIVVHRPQETVRVYVGNIDDRQMRWIAVRKVIEAVIG